MSKKYSQFSRFTILMIFTRKSSENSEFGRREVAGKSPGKSPPGLGRGLGLLPGRALVGLD